MAVIQEIRLSATAGVFVVEVSWNPTIPGVLTVCKSDGSLGNVCDFLHNLKMSKTTFLVYYGASL